MIALALPCKIPVIRNFFKYQVEKYNGKECDYLGFMYGRTKFRSGIINKRLFGKPTYVQFEDTKLPVAEHYHEYLTQVFGNYMQLPPENQRVGLHFIKVDFGKY